MNSEKPLSPSVVFLTTTTLPLNNAVIHRDITRFHYPSGPPAPDPPPTTHTYNSK